MGSKRDRPKDLTSRLREAAVLLAEGVSVGEVVRRRDLAQVGSYRWRKE